MSFPYSPQQQCHCYKLQIEPEATNTLYMGNKVLCSIPVHSETLLLLLLLLHKLQAVTKLPDARFLPFTGEIKEATMPQHLYVNTSSDSRRNRIDHMQTTANAVQID